MCTGTQASSVEPGVRGRTKPLLTPRDHRPDLGNATMSFMASTEPWQDARRKAVWRGLIPNGSSGPVWGTHLLTPALPAPEQLRYITCAKEFQIAVGNIVRVCLPEGRVTDRQTDTGGERHRHNDNLKTLDSELLSQNGFSLSFCSTGGWTHSPGHTGQAFYCQLTPQHPSLPFFVTLGIEPKASALSQTPNLLVHSFIQRQGLTKSLNSPGWAQPCNFPPQSPGVLRLHHSLPFPAKGILLK